MVQTGRPLYGFYFCFELIFRLIIQEEDFKGNASQCSTGNYSVYYRLGRSPAHPN
jgi:hypothetical protein